MIVINEKYGIVLDPDTLTVGTSRPGFYKVTLGPIEDQVTVLEAAVNDLLKALDPYSTFNMAQPNRDGMMSKAGFMTFFMIGVTTALIVVAAWFLVLGGGA
ncbi:Tetrahydromethanopterin S-methyltransferase, subunit B [Candidatus Methanophagaceae archaeon]|jgi:tetrahydromethanopterin S-methyltransferase subunit B|nr:Tetrahydromethanopterin S-methyltransferase, subunit B [Methanophagales archaeon]KAF5435108.1 Tetrahydromethanopterin S-methyltransferase, subunit B [Methanophagales archaeon]